MVAGIEHIGIECSPGLQWENEYRNHLGRHTTEFKMRHQRDRHHEENQKLNHQVRVAKKEVQRLRQDNNLLESENKLLRLQLRDRDESNMISAPVTPNESSEHSLRYASFMLPKFNGIDPTEYARIWMKAVLRCQGIFSWTEAETLLAARVSLEGPARQWLTVQRREVTTWKEFKQAFESRYGKEETSATRIYLALAQRKWIKGEKLCTFMNHIEEMSLKIGLEEKYVMEYLIRGFTDDEFLRTSLRKISTIDELKIVFSQYSEMKFFEDVKDIPTKSSNKICYNCKEVGHLYTSCQHYCEGGIFRLVILIFILLFIIGI